MKQKPMSLSTHMSWLKYPDGKYKRKKISSYVIELYGGTDRGGVIIVWEHTNNYVPNLYEKRSDDKQYTQLGQANFMHYSSAADEYSMLKNVRDVLDLLWRAM